jgi:succinate-semialdehyde dehydrogenase/glutarate-semialdehyde dehydrogenase
VEKGMRNGLPLMNQQLNDPSLLLDRILVNGQWQNTGNTFAVENPATGEVLARGAWAGAEEPPAGVAAAGGALL